MGAILRFLTLRPGAKFNIIIGIIGVAVGVYSFAAFLQLLMLTLARPAYISTPEVSVPYEQLVGRAALALLFLLVGMWRIYRGFRSREKRWLEDPFNHELGKARPNDDTSGSVSVEQK